MKTKLLTALICSLIITGYNHCSNNGFPYKDYTIRGPFSCRNLSVFLLCGNDRITGKEFLTLEEGLEKNMLVVHETGSVNQLAISNKSADTFAFIMAGDIVKGGKQDRVLQNSTVIPPNAEKIPVKSFCVEQGRWHPRNSNEANSFSSSKECLVSKNLKLAARSAKSQQNVWNEVKKTRGKFYEKKQRQTNATGSTIGDYTQSQASPRQQIQNIDEVLYTQNETSLQLALEDSAVQKTVQVYVDSLNNSINKYPDVIGYAFAVNGTINSADLFVSHSLFKKLWKKLLKSSAAEAFAETDTASYAAVSPQAVADWLTASETGVSSTETVDSATESSVIESDANMQYQVHEKGSKEKWLHKNIIKKQ